MCLRSASPLPSTRNQIHLNLKPDTNADPCGPWDQPLNISGPPFPDLWKGCELAPHPMQGVWAPQCPPGHRLGRPAPAARLGFLSGTIALQGTELSALLLFLFHTVT